MGRLITERGGGGLFICWARLAILGWDMASGSDCEGTKEKYTDTKALSVALYNGAAFLWCEHYNY